MNSSSFGARLLVAALLACTCAAHASPAGLTLEGTGPVPAALAAHLAPYTNVRGARFLAWLPDGSLLIRTRFADVDEIHRVAAPLGMRTQLTYSSDPVTEAAAPRTALGRFAFLDGNDGDGMAQVTVYRLADRSVRRLTSGAAHRGGLVWSPDGRELAFYGRDRGAASDDIYVVAASPGARPRLLVAGQQGSWRALDWSPSGAELLVEQDLSREHCRLDVVNAETGAVTPVAISGDESGDWGHVQSARFAPGGLGVYVVSDAASKFAELRYVDLATHVSRSLTASIPWDVDAFDVSPDGRYIAYVVNVDGTSRLTVLDTRYQLHRSAPGIPQGVISNVGFDRTGRHLAMTAESPQSPPDVYVLNVDRNQVVRWTKSEPGPLSASAFVPAELVRYPTWDHDGLHRRMISAYVYRPRTPGPYPVLIDLHDGPHGQARPDFDPFVQLAVNVLGYAVVEPNVRGSSGYGKAFLDLDSGKLRGDAVRDVGSLLVWIGLQPAFDSKHVSVMGSGYGGWLALASLADFNDRLDGGIDFAGITDFVSYIEHAPASQKPALRAEYGDIGSDEVQMILDGLSPLLNERWIQRPLLIVQGLHDATVPAAQSQELLAVLRSRGADAWYLGAQNEGHVFRRRRDLTVLYGVAAEFLESLAHQ